MNSTLGRPVPIVRGQLRVVLTQPTQLVPGQAVDARLLLDPRLQRLNRIVQHNLMRPIRPITPRRVNINTPNRRQFRLQVIVQRMILQRKRINRALNRVTLMFLNRHMLTMLPVTRHRRFKRIAHNSRTQTKLQPPDRSLGIVINACLIFIRTNRTKIQLRVGLIRTVNRRTMFILRMLQRCTRGLLKMVRLISTMAMMRYTRHAPTRMRNKRRVNKNPIRGHLRLIPMIRVFRQRVLCEHTNSRGAIMVIIFRHVRIFMRLSRVVNKGIHNLVHKNLRRISFSLRQQLKGRARRLYFDLSFLERRIRSRRFRQTSTLALHLKLLRDRSTLQVRSVSNQRTAKSLSERIPVVSVFKVAIRNVPVATVCNTLLPQLQLHPGPLTT